jgi:hypothetical protein
MSNNALRGGFREVLRDPALLLIEVAWRWAFGTICIVVCAVLAIMATKNAGASRFTFSSNSQMNPWESAQAIASFLVSLGAALLRAGLFAAVLLAFCWVVLSALGRRATLLRSGLGKGADLRGCFGISTVRALLTLGAVFAWVVAGLVAGAAAAVTNTNGLPNLGVILLILAPALLVIVGAWSVANWYLSLAPLYEEGSWTQAVASVWRLTKLHRDEVLEISIATGVIRFVLFVAALMLSFAVSAVITNPRVFAWDFVAIALLYFFAADFVSIARLAAFAKLRDTQVAISAVPNREDANPPKILVTSENSGSELGSETI